MLDKSLTADEFKTKIKDNLEAIGQVLMRHDDYPEDVSQSELVSVLTTVSHELEVSLENRVPEIVKLNETIAKKDKHIKQLEATNHDLFLRVSAEPNPQAMTQPEAPQVKSWTQIQAEINDFKI